jgi:hypothetical protein
MRLSRKRKAWLKRTAPAGVVNDYNGRPGIAGVRPSFILERGHAKASWVALWNTWRPGRRGVGRFVVTPNWFARYGRRVPKALLRTIRRTPGRKGPDGTWFMSEAATR